jgi:hypothetical protein
MIKLKSFAAAILTAAFAFAGALPAGAVVETDIPAPDRVFYRETAGEAVFGEMDAVYDSVDVSPAKGSMTLTVKNNRTLKPVPNSAYTLYKGTAAIKTGLITDKAGRITVGSLDPGDYKLRPASTPKGYKAAPGVKFSVTSLEIAGGDKEIRTTEGKKIVAGDSEVLIAGKFSPDVELTASHEKQIGSVTVKYDKLRSAPEEKGESKTFEYATLQAAREELNHLKNSGEICGAVHISYKLTEKSGHSCTQYLTEKEPEPTAAPPVNQGGTTNTVTKPKPTAAPTPKVTPAPTATPKPTSTPAPTATPVPDGQLTIACTSGKTGQAFSFEVSGTRAEGGKFSRDYKTGTDGKVITEIPAGKYTVTPKSVKGFDMPEPQAIELTGGGSAYLTFNFVANQRDLTLTVVDSDGQPVPGATVGLFEPGEYTAPASAENPSSDGTDISQNIAIIKSQKIAEEKRADPYTKANAIYVGKTGADGTALIQNVPVAEFVAVPIELPDGYSSEKIATDIHAGPGTKFAVSCKYVAVDLFVWSTGTGSQVIGADLVLLGGDNTELAEWKSEEKPHRLIRVPQGEYELKITQDGQSDTVRFEVGKEKSLQEIQVETYLPGEVSEDKPQGLTLKDYEHILPFVAGGLVLLTGLLIALLIYRDSRKHSGGHR